MHLALEGVHLLGDFALLLGRELLFGFRCSIVCLLFSQVEHAGALLGLKRGALAQVLVDAAGKVGELAIAKERVGVVRDALNEVAIVRNDHQGAWPGVQEGLQFLQGIDVEVIGGLVQ